MKLITYPPGVVTRSMAIKRKPAALEEAKELKKLRFSFEYRRQQWPFRNTFIKYITENSSAKSHKKLVQCCKYFFALRPFLVIPDLLPGYKYFKTSINTSYDLRMISTQKLWISDALIVNGLNRNIIPSLMPIIYRCDVIYLEISEQTLSYMDFVFLASSGERLSFHTVTVKYDDGSVVPFEKIIEALPKAKRILYYSWHPPITSATFKELVKIPHFSKLEWLKLGDIPGTFDLDAFYTYMKENKFTWFELEFKISVTWAFLNRLEEIVDEIIETQTFDYNPPLIKCNLLDRSKSSKLGKIYRSH